MLLMGQLSYLISRDFSLMALVLLIIPYSVLLSPSDLFLHPIVGNGATSSKTFHPTRLRKFNKSLLTQYSRLHFQANETACEKWVVTTTVNPPTMSPETCNGIG